MFFSRRRNSRGISAERFLDERLEMLARHRAFFFAREGAAFRDRVDTTRTHRFALAGAA